MSIVDQIQNKISEIFSIIFKDRQSMYKFAFEDVSKDKLEQLEKYFHQCIDYGFDEQYCLEDLIFSRLFAIIEECFHDVKNIRDEIELLFNKIKIAIVFAVYTAAKFKEISTVLRSTTPEVFLLINELFFLASKLEEINDLLASLILNIKIGNLKIEKLKQRIKQEGDEE